MYTKLKLYECGNIIIYYIIIIIIFYPYYKQRAKCIVWKWLCDKYIIGTIQVIIKQNK